MKISAVLIVRNEEHTIGERIRALSDLNEVIVIDNGSVDATKIRAKESGARVYSVSGLNFSYVRNVGKEQATGDWLLYLDADERGTPEFFREVQECVAHPGRFCAFSVVRKNFFFGREWPKRDIMVRLIRKDALIGWQGTVHETAFVSGAVGRITSPLLHFTHTDISSMVKKTDEWSEIESQLLYKNNHPRVTWWRLFRVVIFQFFQTYIRDGGWCVGTVGIVESMYQSFSSFITYAKLWEKQHASAFGTSSKPL